VAEERRRSSTAFGVGGFVPPASRPGAPVPPAAGTVGTPTHVQSLNPTIQVAAVSPEQAPGILAAQLFPGTTSVPPPPAPIQNPDALRIDGDARVQNAAKAPPRDPTGQRVRKFPDLQPAPREPMARLPFVLGLIALLTLLAVAVILVRRFILL